MIRALIAAVLLAALPSLGMANPPNNNIPQVYQTHAMFTISASCAPGYECTFTAPATLSHTFSAVQYSCWANQTGGSYQYTGVFIECLPKSASSVTLQFMNCTQQTIAAGTTMDISFAAIGT